MVFTLSSICSMVDMPLRTVMMPSREVLYRSAQEAREASGSAFFRTFATSSRTSTKVPPLQGSITTTGTP